MTHTFTVASLDANIRLDIFLSQKLPDLTRSRIKNLIEDGLVSLNNKSAKAGAKIKTGDQISVTIPEPQPIKAEPEKIPLDILYEDKHIIVINKPPGLTVHPGAGRTKGTLVNALLYHCKDLSGIGGALRPGIVHRIDKDTSGVLVAAKTDKSHQFLSKQFKEHSMKRRYLALVWGVVKNDIGTIDLHIGRHVSERKKMSVRTSRGRRAVTHYKVIKRFDNFTLIEATLETGRTHQIRVHLSAIHHPVVGDPVYGKKNMPSGLSPKLTMLLKNLKRQALHAQILGIIHPETQKYMEWTAPLPDDIKGIITALEEAC
ncbi:MAG: pseudouridine synthase [Deltaproteobacteria bacterium RIFCSPLOWO2_12_FULL_43_16]|nr:MAG: pseudouridine synthase [Deltaproteobacteria bacterium GWA2_43_19]OGQ09577.1 MAG: pseudouridine synthase [Deltaproteobacteria bacterium RIFCSPHIGHO2_02_FULL_43_33]OGQ58212.1 MAG: pseudouridine synthase [Deltaproteobacteria bacterium RIFCSPLOWO2_12_FULL_43_16]HBR16218.1 RluA family pseudouridine synthase [Deltaproteobacteria bacterium]